MTPPAARASTEHGPQAVRRHYPAMVALRRALHEDPEIGLACERTSARLQNALEGLPLEIRLSSRTGGFVAILRGGMAGSRTVLLRGDMDALPMQEETGLSFASKVPGIMHACGHDAHSAMLVCAARLLCERRDRLPGTVLFMFQPGEEGYHGAREMIAEGMLADPLPDAAFALHITPNLPAGTIAGRAGALLASMDTLKATITGRGGHAAMPHETRDPIPAACEIVLALQSAVTRRVPVDRPGVLSVTQLHAGTAHNVIPATVELTATLRAVSEDTRDFLQGSFCSIVSGIAAAHDLVGDTGIEAGYPVTINDPRAHAMIANWARADGGTWIELPSPIMGSEDFAYVLQRIPGAMAFLGVAPVDSDPSSNPPIHNTRMLIEEEAMIRGAAYHCAMAEAYLASGWPS